jgi:hypothetical protein
MRFQPASKLASIVLSGFALAVTVAPVLATPIIFAGYVPTSGPAGALNFSLTSTALNGNLNTFRVDISDTEQVSFFYNVGGTGFGFGSQAATLTLNATSTASGNCPSGDGRCDTLGAIYTESGFAGSFSFISLSGHNLLSGTFDVSPGAQFASATGALSGTLEATANSSNPNQLVFTSEFLNFADALDRDAKFSLASFSQAFSLINNSAQGLNLSPASFTAFASGNFSVDTGVPEPTSFALLAGGLLVLCLWQRKRRLLHR